MCTLRTRSCSQEPGPRIRVSPVTSKFYPSDAPSGRDCEQSGRIVKSGDAKSNNCGASPDIPNHLQPNSNVPTQRNKRYTEAQSLVAGKS